MGVCVCVTTTTIQQHTQSVKKCTALEHTHNTHKHKHAHTGRGDESGCISYRIENTEAYPETTNGEESVDGDETRNEKSNEKIGRSSKRTRVKQNAQNNSTRASPEQTHTRVYHNRLADRRKKHTNPGIVTMTRTHTPHRDGSKKTPYVQI
eukprot:GDKI01004163.1.p3 GENE.GDKI01004163.1~~GDKI01004163.1.p3  ORF type:complete len:151 (+),score=39.08 GDKI01004163.1:511-963(+)